MILIVVFEFNRVAPWSIPDTQAQVIGGALVGTAVFPAVYNLLSQPDVAKQLVDNPLADLISNIDLDQLNPFSGQTAVQQRSSVEGVSGHQVHYAPAPAYPQPVYPGPDYQQ